MFHARLLTYIFFPIFFISTTADKSNENSEKLDTSILFTIKLLLLFYTNGSFIVICTLFKLSLECQNVKINK